LRLPRWSWRGDGTGNFKHFIKNAKKRAKDYPFREDQQGGSEVLMERLDDDVEEFDNSMFDTCSNEKLVRAVRKLILKSGKKKSNLMATLSFMHPKYKDELGGNNRGFHELLTPRRQFQVSP
jgi:hypothetical protein